MTVRCDHGFRLKTMRYTTCISFSEDAYYIRYTDRIYVYLSLTLSVTSREVFSVFIDLHDVHIICLYRHRHELAHETAVRLTHDVGGVTAISCLVAQELALVCISRDAVVLCDVLPCDHTIVRYGEHTSGTAARQQ